MSAIRAQAESGSQCQSAASAGVVCVTAMRWRAVSPAWRPLLSSPLSVQSLTAGSTQLLHTLRELLSRITYNRHTLPALFILK